MEVEGHSKCILQMCTTFVVHCALVLQNALCFAAPALFFVLRQNYIDKIHPPVTQQLNVRMKMKTNNIFIIGIYLFYHPTRIC